MLVNQESWEDFKKYYEKTWVKFPKLSQDTLWFVERVTPEFAEVSTSNHDEAMIDLKRGYDMDFVIPKKTVYQYGDSAACLSRIPARMWKKGMSKANTQFQVLLPQGWMAVNFDPQIIEGFINKPSYLDVYPNITKLQGENPELISMAITPRISMNGKGNVFIDSVMVAKYVPKTSTITVKSLFAPEIVPHFNKEKVKLI